MTSSPLRHGATTSGLPTAPSSSTTSFDSSSAADCCSAGSTSASSSGVYRDVQSAAAVGDAHDALYDFHRLPGIDDVIDDAFGGAGDDVGDWTFSDADNSVRVWFFSVAGPGFCEVVS